MSRIFVVIAGLVIFGASAQAQPPQGSSPIFQNGQNQYDGPYAQQPDTNQYPDNQYDDADTNYVETPSYDAGNNYGDDSSNGNSDDNNYGNGDPGDYQPQQPPAHGGSNQGPSSEEMDRLYQSVLESTQGECNIKENPHSFGCTEWTFKNNPVFPLFQMDWRGLQGEWFTVTYVNKTSGNKGREFYMAKNPERPTQPMGVKNTGDDSLVGRLSIKGTQVTFENWRGHRVSSDPTSFKVKDDYTVQFDLWTGPQGKQTLHSFDCRDFNRNNEHHLLCDWWVKTGPSNADWLFKGYFGFITLDVWEGFLSQAGQH